MRIKQLELIGFKSFPQKTVLDVPRGVSAIVGPNGCGKSNVVDAIRWVLGEQSPKHLRGDAMEAVIFNGNERLSPLGMAEVSLTFENDGSARMVPQEDLEISSLPAHFRGLAEIRVTRRYLRSGESEYSINRTPCRLKDITELFLGTGIGSKAYAIIQQGKVEQLINAKPEDRRLFIEEAAGTTLYRSRKLTAERKMERTRDNLARVSDVLGEIERQIRYLERQARRAEQYRTLQAEMRDLEMTLATVQWRDLAWRLTAVEEELEEVRGREAELRGALEELEESREQARGELESAEQHQMQIREALATAEAERESARERIAMLERERAERGRRHERLVEERGRVEAGIESLGCERSRVQDERLQWAERLREDEEDLHRQRGALESDRRALEELRRAVDDAKGALVHHMTREVEARNTVTALEQRRESLQRQAEKLRAEEEEIARRVAETEAQLETRRADLQGLRDRLAALSGEKETCAEELRSLAEQRRHWEREVGSLETSLVQVRSRLESLEEIQRNYEGYHRGVRAIMREEQHPDGVLGVVADVLDIPEPYERAVAAALGERLQYVIVRAEGDGATAVDLLRREAGGRGSFIPLQPRLDAQRLQDAASLNGTSTRLLEQVRFDEQYKTVVESLLGEVVLVPSMHEAVDIWRRNGVHVTLVTPEGDVMTPEGVITGGSERPIEEELLARRREMESLRVRQQEIDARLAVTREELAGIEQQMAEHEEMLRRLGEDTHQLTLEIVATEKDIERLELEQPRLASRRDVVRYEAAGVREEDLRLAEQLEEARYAMRGLGEEHARLEGESEERRCALEEATARVESRAIRVTEAQVRVAERREREQASADKLSSIERQLADLHARRTGIAGEVEQTEVERQGLEQAVAASREREAEGARRQEGLREEAECAESRVREHAVRLREIEERGRETHRAVDEVRSRRSEQEVVRSEARMRSEHLQEAIREKYQTDIAEHAGAVGEVEVPEGASERLENVRGRLARLGDVNVAAIDELRELEERRDFLREQYDDLQRSLADLERTIQKLNRISRTRFAEAFQRANETFQKVFPRLFRGGEARLVLTDEHNLLESGVDIVVRPPGKRLDNVALLSGGEKALVAVSLIFSLFLINPTPFCILDEVDAPLDDANIGRFSQMIREMSEKLQFMVITHNKRTMECADILYGVTMQEPGVSKVISVDIHA